MHTLHSLDELNPSRHCNYLVRTWVLHLGFSNTSNLNRSPTRHNDANKKNTFSNGMAIALKAVSSTDGTW